MADLRMPRTVMLELMALPVADRQAREPADGVEELVSAYIEEALSQRDGGMMKYLIETIQGGESEAVEAVSKKDRINSWLTKADGAING